MSANARPSGLDGKFPAGFGLHVAAQRARQSRAGRRRSRRDSQHTPGEFRAAFSDQASEHNERNLIVLDDAVGQRHALVQMAGYLARRIVCRLRDHDKIEAGQRIGLIMFGSRVDHFMPLQYRVACRVGERVRAGESVIGELAQ